MRVWQCLTPVLYNTTSKETKEKDLRILSLRNLQFESCLVCRISGNLELLPWFAVAVYKDRVVSTVFFIQSHRRNHEIMQSLGRRFQECQGCFQTTKDSQLTKSWWSSHSEIQYCDRHWIFPLQQYVTSTAFLCVDWSTFFWVQDQESQNEVFFVVVLRSL